MAAGLALLEQAQDMEREVPYGIKACIAALHVAAPRSDLTDWAAIVRLYDRLLPGNPPPSSASTGPWLWPWPTHRRPDWPSSTTPTWLGNSTATTCTRPPEPTCCATARPAGDESAESYRLARDQTNNVAEHQFLDRRLDQLTALGPDAD